jgi:hypothetical protein
VGNVSAMVARKLGIRDADGWTLRVKKEEA